MNNKKSFKDILKEFKENLDEGELGRLFQHYTKRGEKSFVIITAWRKYEEDGKTLKASKKNMKNLKSLENDIRDLGLGFHNTRGGWKECKNQDIPYENCPEELKEDVSEPSLFVPGLNLEKTKELVNKYNQDSALYNGPDTNGHTVIVYKNGNLEDLGEGFHPDQIAKYYTEIKGKRFRLGK